MIPVRVKGKCFISIHWSVAGLPASLHILLSLFLCIFFRLSIRIALDIFEVHPHPLWLQVNLVTSPKSLLPNKITFWVFLGQDLTLLSLESIFYPIIHPKIFLYHLLVAVCLLPLSLSRDGYPFGQPTWLDVQLSLNGWNLVPYYCCGDSLLWVKIVFALKGWLWHLW